MTRQKVLFRADGNTQTGLGHVYRSLSLLEMLAPAFDVAFAIKEPSEAVRTIIGKYTKHILEIPTGVSLEQELAFLNAHIAAPAIIVIDGYHFDEAYQQQVKAAGYKLVFIDDVPRQHYYADVIINHGEGVKKEAYSAESYTQFYLGATYALLREPFLEAAGKQRHVESINNIFVSMGGADIHNISEKVINASLGIEGIKEINVVIGSASPHFERIKSLSEQEKRIKIYYNLESIELCGLLKRCQLAVAPASSISFEISAVGLGFACGYSADNQLGIYEGLINKGLVFPLGNLLTITNEVLVNSIKECMQHIDKVNEKITLQKRYIDGNSGKRLINIFQSIG